MRGLEKCSTNYYFNLETKQFCVMKDNIYFTDRTTMFNSRIK